METEGAFERRMVLPGDAIAAAEEYEAGEGTYEKDGQIFAAIPGLLELDGENFVARVRPCRPLELKGQDLWCPRCERTERRKIASDYGRLMLSSPATELGAGVVTVEPPRAREGGGGRGGPRGRGGGGYRGGGGRGGGRGRGG